MKVVGAGIDVGTACLEKMRMFVDAFLKDLVAPCTLNAQQHTGVRVQGTCREGITADNLHQPTSIHNTNTVSSVRHGVQVVRDEYERQTSFSPQPQHEYEYLRGYKRIKTRCRLVSNQDVRLNQQCTTHRNPLTLTAGQL